MHPAAVLVWFRSGPEKASGWSARCQRRAMYVPLRCLQPASAVCDARTSLGLYCPAFNIATFEWHRKSVTERWKVCAKETEREIAHFLNMTYTVLCISHYADPHHSFCVTGCFIQRRPLHYEGNFLYTVERPHFLPSFSIFVLWVSIVLLPSFLPSQFEPLFLLHIQIVTQQHQQRQPSLTDARRDPHTSHISAYIYESCAPALRMPPPTYNNPDNNNSVSNSSSPVW